MEKRTGITTQLKWCNILISGEAGENGSNSLRLKFVAHIVRIICHKIMTYLSRWLISRFYFRTKIVPIPQQGHRPGSYLKGESVMEGQWKAWIHARFSALTLPERIISRNSRKWAKSRSWSGNEDMFQLKGFKRCFTSEAPLYTTRETSSRTSAFRRNSNCMSSTPGRNMTKPFATIHRYRAERFHSVSLGWALTEARKQHQ